MSKSKIYSPEELNSFSKETLVAVILSMQDQLSQLNANMERLIEQIADASNKRYGSSSEKLDVIAGQLELELIFNEAEALTETLYVVEPAEEDVIQVSRRKRKGKREEDLKDLPLQELFGPDGWKRLPDEVYKRVRVQPAVYTVEEHHVAVYAGKDNQTIVKADRPRDLLRNSILTPSLAASIMNAKYVNGLPLYRIRRTVPFPCAAGRRNSGHGIEGWASRKQQELYVDLPHWEDLQRYAHRPV